MEYLDEQQDLGGFFDFLKPKPRSYEDMPPLSKGASGVEVSQLQELLNSAGQNVSVDGQFGSGTENALKVFQQSEGISPSGVADQQTWAALLGENYRDPGKQAQTTETIGQVAGGLISSLFVPPANQQELMQQPVQETEESEFPWLLVGGTVVGLGVVGVGLYFLLRE